MAAIFYNNVNKIDSTSPTNSTYCSWDNREEDEVYWTYTGTIDSPIEEVKAKWHAFCFWLNKILDPPEESLRPPEKPPPRKSKVILYGNVKLARAPPLAFLLTKESSMSIL